MPTQALQAKQHYRIKAFSPDMDKKYRRKLLSMGMMPGVEFYVTRFAPLGNTLQIEVNDFSLSLRSSELSCLRLERTRL